MKKILSLVLVLSLVLGTFSFAFAATPSDVVDTDYEEAVETLMALGVVDGYEDGTYKPEKAVTRAEMAKLLVEALGYGELAAGATASFTDAQGHWAESYIGFAASMDLVLGYPDGTFKPNQVMSMDEAMTMVIRALGYTDEVLKGSWPTNYKVKALDLELTDGLSSLSGEGLRGNVAMLLFNALDARLVEVIKDANGLYSYDYIEIDENTDKKLIDQIGVKDDMTVMPEDVSGDDAKSVAGNVNLEDYLYENIDFYGTDDYDVAYVAGSNSDVFAGTITATTAGAITVTDAEDTDKEFDTFADAVLYLNGDETTVVEIDELDVDQAEVKVVYDDDDSDDTVSAIVAWDSEAYLVANEYSDRRPTELDRIELPADDDELDTANLVVEGDVDSLEDIEENDVVHVYATDDVDVETTTPDKVKLVVVRDTFTGKLTEIDGDSYVVGGDDFDLSVYVDNFTGFTTSDLGKDFVLYLDKDGDVFSAEEESDTAAAEGYAVFIDEGNGSIYSDQFGNKSIYQGPVIKLFTDGGDVVIYELDIDDLDLDDDTDYVELGSIVVDNDDPTITISYANGTSFIRGDLVEIELNEDGQITSMVEVGNDYTDVEDDMVEGNDITSSTVIFNVDLSASNEDDWKIIDNTNINDSTDGFYALATDGFDVEAMTVEGILTSTGTYGIVTKVVDYYDGDATVQKATVLVNGEEVVYVTTEDDSVLAGEVDEVVELTLDGALLDDVTTEPAIETNIEITEVDGSRVRVEGVTTPYTFADNVAVYVVDDGDFTAEDVNYLRSGDYVSLYEDTDNDIVIIVFDVQFNAAQ